MAVAVAGPGALIRTLAWEHPYAAGAALKSNKTKTNKKEYKYCKSLPKAIQDLDKLKDTLYLWVGCLKIVIVILLN